MKTTNLETKLNSVQVDVLCFMHVIKSLLVRVHSDLLSLFQRVHDVFFPVLGLCNVKVISWVK